MLWMLCGRSLTSISICFKLNGSAYQNNSLKTRSEKVRVKTMSRHFMLFGEIKVVDRSRDGVDKPKVGCLLQAVSNIQARWL